MEGRAERRGGGWDALKMWLSPHLITTMDITSPHTKIAILKCLCLVLTFLLCALTSHILYIVTIQKTGIISRNYSRGNNDKYVGNSRFYIMQGE